MFTSCHQYKNFLKFYRLNLECNQILNFQGIYLINDQFMFIIHWKHTLKI